MRTCAIISCHSRAGTPGISFFRLPRKEPEAKEWIRFITVANYGTSLEGKKHISICSEHFRDCCINSSLLHKKSLRTGHYPSVVEGKVLINDKSECPPLSSKEQLYTEPLPKFNNVSEKRKAYLTKKLTSFSVPKIVLGNPPFKMCPPPAKRAKISLENLSIKAIPSNGELHEMKPDEAVSSPPTEATETKENPPVFFTGEDVEVKIFSDADKDKDKKSSIKSKANSKKRSVHVHSSSSSPPPSSEKGNLKRENKALRKSVSRLERMVGNISEELKIMKTRTETVEEQYNKLILAFQNVLEQNQGGNETTTSSSSRRCTCREVELVHISDDDDDDDV